MGTKNLALLCRILGPCSFVGRKLEPRPRTQNALELNNHNTLAKGKDSTGELKSPERTAGVDETREFFDNAGPAGCGKRNTYKHACELAAKNACKHASDLAAVITCWDQKCSHSKKLFWTASRIVRPGLLAPVPHHAQWRPVAPPDHERPGRDQFPRGDKSLRRFP